MGPVASQVERVDDMRRLVRYMKWPREKEILVVNQCVRASSAVSKLKVEHNFIDRDAWAKYVSDESRLACGA